MAPRKRGWTPVFGQIRCANKKLERRFRFQFKVRRSKQVFPKVAAGFGSKNLLDEGS
jgi:hypothetical protein